MMLLSKANFIEKLKSELFTDVQSFRKAVQVLAKGGRSELESRLIEYKDNHDNRDVLRSSDSEIKLQWMTASLRWTGS